MAKRTSRPSARQPQEMTTKSYVYGAERLNGYGGDVKGGDVKVSGIVSGIDNIGS